MSISKTITENPVVKMTRDLFKHFGAQNSMFHGAALAYYAVFAMVPLLYLAISGFGLFVGNETMVEVISTILKENVGIKDSSGILDFLNTLDFEHGNVLLSIMGIGALVISSTAFLTSLRNSLNDFFDVKLKHTSARKKIMSNLISRGTSLGLMMLTGVTVIVFYFAESVFLSMVGQLIEGFDLLNGFVRFLIVHAVPIVSNTVIFIFVFKFLHDGKVTWALAKRGAFFTGILLYLGQILIKYYLTNYFFASGSGVAGSIIVILVWMFYTSQIIFLGASFTKVLGKKINQEIKSR